MLYGIERNDGLTANPSKKPPDNRYQYLRLASKTIHTANHVNDVTKIGYKSDSL